MIYISYQSEGRPHCADMHPVMVGPMAQVIRVLQISPVALLDPTVQVILTVPGFLTMFGLYNAGGPHRTETQRH